MGTMILCRDKVAATPLYISSLDVSLYTEEELCYYIYNNIYILTNDFVSDDLIHFLREETKDAPLADRIEELRSQGAGLAAILVTILKSVDYYSISEIDQISEILSVLDSQNVYERLKSRADTYLERKNYYKAADCYRNIIEEYKCNAPGAFVARVYHNLGVSYARMFLYTQAAESFKTAYDIGQYQESYKSYLSAKWFIDRNNGPLNEEASEEECAVRKRIESLMDNAQYQDEYRRLEELENRKEQGDVAYYNRAVKDMIKEWKKDYCKYTAR